MRGKGIEQRKWLLDANADDIGICSVPAFTSRDRERVLGAEAEVVDAERPAKHEADAWNRSSLRSEGDHSDISTKHHVQ